MLNLGALDESRARGNESQPFGTQFAGETLQPRLLCGDDCRFRLERNGLVSRGRRNRSNYFLYVFSKPFRELTTVKLPSAEAEALIQCPSELSSIFATKSAAELCSGPAAIE
jgi:hypothetical protein